MEEKFVWLAIGLCFGMPLGWLGCSTRESLGGQPTIWPAIPVMLIGCILVIARIYEAARKKY